MYSLSDLQFKTFLQYYYHSIKKSCQILERNEECQIIEIKIPKEIRQYKESIFFGLSARQFFCSIAAVLVATVIYLVLGKAIGKDTASWLCIIMAAPLAVAGFFNYNGMNMEQFIWAFIKSEFLLSAPRKYISERGNIPHD